MHAFIRKILLLESDEALGKLLTDKLSSVGYTVAHYDTPTDIIAGFFEQPDLFLIGHQNPLVNAPVITRIFKEQPLTNQIPIIVFARGADIQRELTEAGIQDVIERPVTQTELLRRIEGLIIVNKEKMNGPVL